MPKVQIIIDADLDQPFRDAAQEQYVLSSIEDAIGGELWHDMIANKDSAPQVFSNVTARVKR